MGKKSSKRGKQSQAATQPLQAQPHCPYCGTMNSEKTVLSLMDQLLRSHAELSSTLRLAGRQMLQFEKRGDESLERIRKVLRRADNVRKLLPGTDELPEALKNAEADHLVMAAPGPAAEYSPDQIANQARKNQNKARLTRPRSSRIIRFPAR
jgi:hypothetical protein